MTQSQTTAPSLLGLEEDGRDLFGLAAHKLNTPLACIRGFVSTLLQRGEQLDTETVQQFLQLVLTQTDRLQGLVRDFLLLARVNGGIEALARPFRPRDVLLALVDDLSEEGVRVRFAGAADAELVGDAELVKLALRPLVENGLAYGPRLGMVTVTVAAGPERSRWEVHDGGSRLTNERINQLFRPFTRSDEPVERRRARADAGPLLRRGARRHRGGARRRAGHGLLDRGAGPRRRGGTGVSEASERDGNPTRVLVVDDHSVTRHGVVLLCTAAEGVEVIGEAADGNEAIERVGELLPDVVLMDVDMPRRDGISATKQIRQDHPNVGVVVLTVHEDQETIFEAIKAGASGYLPKSATLDDIRSAVKAVAAGGSFLDPVQARKLLHQFNRYADETKAAADIYYLLTGREREILALLAEGLTSRQIASQLVISERTVNTHIGNIYRKLHVNNRVDAVREAMRIRLVEPPR